MSTNNVGGWSEFKKPLLGDPIWDIFASIFPKLLGAEYELIVYCEQVVAGKNYCLEVKVTPVSPNAETKTKWAIIHKPLNGEAVLNGLFDNLPI